MDDEEQVVGVVKFCEVCGEKTVHIDGVCRDHKIVRRRKQAVVEQAVEDEPADRPAPVVRKKKKKKKQSRIGTVFAFLFVGALIAGMGFIHIAYGGSSAIKVCKKDGWSLKHTVVSVPDEVTAPKRNTELLATLAKCGAVAVDSK